MIIAISGKFCSGKDTVADFLVEKYGFRKVGFADKLYEVARDLFGMKQKDRTLLQVLGNTMRGVRQTVWIDYVLDAVGADEYVVIKDMRYKNEFQAALVAGAVTIRLNCEEGERLRRYKAVYGVSPTTEQINFISEVDLDGEKRFDLFIDSGQPREKVFKILSDFLATNFSFKESGENETTD